MDKPWIKSEFSFEVVDWVTDESRQGVNGDGRMDIDLVEKEVLDFKTRLEVGGDKGVEESIQTSAWRKWEGEWTPRPIGVL